MSTALARTYDTNKIVASGNKYPVQPSAVTASTFNQIPDSRRPRKLFDLLSALEFLSRLEDDWNGWEAIAPTAKTIQMTESFLWSIPLRRDHADKIEPDGDGGVHLKWVLPNSTVIVTIDGSYIYLSSEEASGNVKILGPIPFFDDSIRVLPPEILDQIPLLELASP